MRTKCLILGSGPAGYTAAIYATRANLQPILYEGMQQGGQLTTTTDIENFPGFPNPISGTALMDNLRQQAQRLGADLRPGIATNVNLAEPPYAITIDNHQTLHADTLIIATGAAAKYLGLPDEQKYAGMGVSACAVCDGFFYRNKPVAVVGGGDSACQEALYLASLASHVFLIVRKNYLRASHILQQRVRLAKNIEILFERNVTGLFGHNALEGAHLVQRRGLPDEQTTDIRIDGLFLAIGHTPHSQLFQPWLDLDPNGYIRTCPGSTATYRRPSPQARRTCLPGVFAAGDVADPHYRQAVTAAAAGCRAALEAERFLAHHSTAL